MIPILRMNPRERGTRCWLGPLETDVMEIAWASAEVTVRQVWRQLYRGRDIAYTTVLCTMTRLAMKGLLAKRHSSAPGRGSVYLFAATCTEDEFIELQTRHVLAALEGVTV